MSTAFDPTWAIIAVMTAAAMLLRFGGFWFMRLVPMSGRVRAGLAAMPLAVMIGILAPPMLRGGTPEWIGLGAVALLAWRGANEVVALIGGMAVVAAFRYAGLG
jgi:uncharacterized membrane protein